MTPHPKDTDAEADRWNAAVRAELAKQMRAAPTISRASRRALLAAAALYPFALILSEIDGKRLKGGVVVP